MAKNSNGPTANATGAWTQKMNLWKGKPELEQWPSLMLEFIPIPRLVLKGLPKQRQMQRPS